MNCRASWPPPPPPRIVTDAVRELVEQAIQEAPASWVQAGLRFEHMGPLLLQEIDRLRSLLARERARALSIVRDATFSSADAIAAAIEQEPVPT